MLSLTTSRLSGIASFRFWQNDIIILTFFIAPGNDIAVTGAISIKYCTGSYLYKFGGYGVRGKGDTEAERLMNDARMLQELGCFAVVLEKIPAKLAAHVTQALTIPTIGIGLALIPMDRFWLYRICLE